MPASSSKHPRATSESEADSDARAYKVVRSDSALPAASPVSNTASTSPATFWHLAIELRSIIFDLATQRRPQPNDSLGRRGLLRLDYGTLRSLTLVSRQFHAAFKPVLFAHVKITRPSVLAEFRRSLVLNPENGALVKSLHLGPLEELPKGYWPLRTKHVGATCCSDCDDGETLLLIKTSWTRHDHLTRPRWCCPEKEWALEMPTLTCQGRAVDAAIQTATKAVGVTLADPAYTDDFLCDAEGGYIDLDEWTARVFEVQAVLDLYLAQMRQVEQQEGHLLPSWQSKQSLPKGAQDCREGKCGHYPRLVLDDDFEGVGEKVSKAASTQRKGGSSSKAAFGKASITRPSRDDIKSSSFVVTRAQVNDHLSRRDSIHDHFDHPFILARSKARQLSTDGYGTITSCYNGYEDEYHYDYDSDDESEFAERWRCNDDDYASPASPSPQSPTMHRSPSLDSLAGYDLDATRRDNIIALGRSTIRLTPHLQSLSVTGYLHNCVNWPPLRLNRLRYVCLGPVTPADEAPSYLFSLGLAAMEKFRLCGDALGTITARRIGGMTREWPCLKEVQWEYGPMSMAKQHLLNQIHLVQGRDVAGSSEKRQQPVDAACLGGETSAAQEVEANQQSEDRYTEARLHPHLVALALKNASNSEERNAWLNGSSLPDALHRVKLVESRAAPDLANPSSRIFAQDFQILREESEKWWEERALEIEGSGQLAFL